MNVCYFTWNRHHIEIIWYHKFWAGKIQDICYEIDTVKYNAKITKLQEVEDGLFWWKWNKIKRAETFWKILWDMKWEHL